MPSKKPVQACDEPFQEVLRSVGNLLHIPRRHTCKEKLENTATNPGHDHGIGDR